MMNKSAIFKRLFGIDPGSVRRTCILLPLLSRDMLSQFGINSFSRGLLYRAANTPGFTIVNTGMGASRVGDAVLYLAQTRCRNVILFGSCGAAVSGTGLDIGSLVCPSKCLSAESFSRFLLAGFSGRAIFRPDHRLRQEFMRDYTVSVNDAVCLTVGSLKLERDYVRLRRFKKAQVLDMECSAFFCAAGYARLKAMALFYVSDIAVSRPFYRYFSPGDKAAIRTAVIRAAGILSGFIAKNGRL